MRSFIKKQRNSSNHKVFFAALAFLCLLINADFSQAQSILVKTLDKPELDMFGMLDGTTGGIPKNSWKDTSYEQILLLLDKQPVNSRSPIMQELLRRTVLSKTIIPKSNNDRNDIFLKRLSLLIKLGEYRSLQNLLGMIPGSEFNEKHAKIEAQVDLLSRNYVHLCERNKLHTELYGSDYWQKIRLFCLAINNKKDELELGIRLLIEQEAMNVDLSCCDVSFEELLRTIANKKNIKDLLSSFFSSGEYTENLFKPAEDGTVTISPLDFALLEASKAPFSEKIIRNASPGVLRSIALYSHTPLDMKIYAAELALGSGSMSVDEISELYKQYIWAGGIETPLTNPFLTLRRAALFQVLESTPVPSRTLLEKIIQSYKESNLQHISHFVLAPTFSKLSENIYGKPELLEIADIAITSLLASRRNDQANIWYRMVELFEAKDEKATKIARLVRPLTRGTVPIGPSWKEEYASLWWQNYNPKNKDQKYFIAGRLFSVIHAFRHHIPSELWEIILRNSNTDKLEEYPAPSIVGNLKSSAQKKKIGETILLSLMYMGNKMPYEVHDNVVSDIIRALLAVGMKNQAQSLAVESIANHPDY